MVFLKELLHEHDNFRKIKRYSKTKRTRSLTQLASINSQVNDNYLSFLTRLDVESIISV